MSKIITVAGSSDSGKTTAALKFAQEIHESKSGSVIFLSPDIQVPVMGFLFPHCKESDLYSVGKTLDKTDIFKEDVQKSLVTVKTMKNFGILGYKAGETYYSYPRPTEDKIYALFRACKELADYLVVDVSSDEDDLISAMAVSEAETVVQMITPDLKCMTYYSSHNTVYKNLQEKIIKVMNINDRDLYLPIAEVKEHFKNVQFTLPYSRALKQQAITGTLSERVPDQKYRSVMTALVKAVV